MSATLIDTPVEGKPAANSQEAVTLDSTIEAVAEPAPAPVEPPVVDDLPDKYKGKSIADVVKMHQNAESLNGRQSSEVGELRKIVDDFIVTQSQSTNPVQTEEDDLDFLDDPKAAMQRAIDNHPTIKKAEKVVQNAEKSDANQQAQEALLAAHPDTVDIIGDEKFVAWITSSPTRTRMLSTANSSNDVEAMSEILGEWKSQPAAVATDTGEVAAQQQQQTQQASTGAMEGGHGENKKVFRRTDLIQLKIKDPARYTALQPEIMAAYAEKRVI